MAKWLPLMRVGQFRDRHNKLYTITQETIAKIAGSYNPEKPAHILVGHPDKKTVPSFGIVEALKVAGDRLLFRPGKVVAEFAALVRQGGFPGVSAGLDKSCSGLDHVAFLSAQKPAIDGLEPICEFSAAEEDFDKVNLDVTDIIKLDLAEFASPAESWLVWRMHDIARLMRHMKNSMVEKDGLESADKVMPEYLIAELSDDPPAEPNNTISPQFSNPNNGGNMEFEKLYKELLPQFETQKTQLAEFSTANATLTTELTQLKEQNAGLITKLTTLESANRNAEFSAFVETLISEGRILPDQKDNEIAILETMHAATPVEFSSANGEKSPVDKYKDSLKVRPVVVPRSGETTEGPEFSAGSDPVAVGLAARRYIDEQKAKGVTVSEIDAVKHISRK